MEPRILPVSSSEDGELLSGTLPSSKEKNRQFVLFHKVQGAMRHVPNFVETCEAILDAVMDELNADKCSVMLKDPVSGRLSLLASRGKNDEKSGYRPDHAEKGDRSRLEEGIAGWVLKKGEAVTVNDVKNEPRFVKVDGLHNEMRSLLCYPIRDKDQVVGVFNLSHSRIGAFGEGDRMALPYISTQVGAALTSARFFVKIRDTQQLMKDSPEPIPGQSAGTKSSASPTFIEVGEMMPGGNGIFLYEIGRAHV